MRTDDREGGSLEVVASDDGIMIAADAWTATRENENEVMELMFILMDWLGVTVMNDGRR